MRRISAIAILVILAACTQKPADYVDNSQTFFGKDFSSTITETGYDAAVETARYGYDIASSSLDTSSNIGNAGSVGVSDLKPITSSELSSPTAQGNADYKPVQEMSITADADESKKFIWPVHGRVTNRFSTGNDGITIAADEGKPIHAAAEGTVVYAGNELKDYGNMVIIRHVDGYMTAYAHQNRISVKKNDKVQQGDIIGTVGRTGGVNEAQLHFGIRSGKQAVDPEKYLPKSVAGL